MERNDIRAFFGEDTMREMCSIYIWLYDDKELLPLLRKRFPYHSHDFLKFVCAEYLKETNPCKQE